MFVRGTDKFGGGFFFGIYKIILIILLIIYIIEKKLSIKMSIIYNLFSNEK